MNGYLPDRITYVCAKKEKSEIWDDESENVIATFKVCPTFPIETGRKLDTAIEWASDKGYTPVCDDLPNEPISNVQIMGLEERGNGGRAYKVTLNDNYYVDMREDTILEAIFDGGILPGGVLTGEYVWGKIGSQLKLVKVGSSTHKVLMQGINTSKAVELKSSDIKIGGLYRRKSGGNSLYLGSFYTYDLNYETHKCGRDNIDRAHSLTKKKVYLFLDVNEGYYKKDYNGTINDVLNAKPEDHIYLKDMHDGRISNYQIVLYKSMPKFILEVGVCDLGNYDYAEEIGKISNQYDDNPYMRNWQVDKSCLGKDAPILRNKVATLNLHVISKAEWEAHTY
jgi:hypothetical protein